MHGVMHVGWAPDGTGGYRGQMAVYVNPNGLLGSAYMVAIRPFRRLIVYPSMLRQLELAWAAASGDPSEAGWTVLYDADCGFCNWALSALLRWDRGGRLRPVGLRRAEADQLLHDLTPAERKASWHLISPTGERRSGGAALPRSCGRCPEAGCRQPRCAFPGADRSRLSLGGRSPRRLRGGCRRAPSDTPAGAFSSASRNEPQAARGSSRW